MVYRREALTTLLLAAFGCSDNAKNRDSFQPSEEEDGAWQAGFESGWTPSLEVKFDHGYETPDAVVVPPTLDEDGVARFVVIWYDLEVTRPACWPCQADLIGGLMLTRFRQVAYCNGPELMSSDARVTHRKEAEPTNGEVNEASISVGPGAHEATIQYHLSEYDWEEARGGTWMEDRCVASGGELACRKATWGVIEDRSAGELVEWSCSQLQELYAEYSS